MLRGLVQQTPDGPQVSNAYTATDTGTGGIPATGGYPGAPAFNTGGLGVSVSGSGSPVTTTTSVSETAGPTTADVVDSHLDSFFETSALTREDVLVLAALVQSVAWVALLYLEVTE